MAPREAEPTNEEGHAFDPRYGIRSRPRTLIPRGLTTRGRPTFVTFREPEIQAYQQPTPPNRYRREHQGQLTPSRRHDRDHIGSFQWARLESQGQPFICQRYSRGRPGVFRSGRPTLSWSREPHIGPRFRPRALTTDSAVMRSIGDLQPPYHPGLQMFSYVSQFPWEHIQTPLALGLCQAVGRIEFWDEFRGGSRGLAFDDIHLCQPFRKDSRQPVSFSLPLSHTVASLRHSEPSATPRISSPRDQLTRTALATSPPVLDRGCEEVRGKIFNILGHFATRYSTEEPRHLLVVLHQTLQMTLTLNSNPNYQPGNRWSWRVWRTESTVQSEQRAPVWLQFVRATNQSPITRSYIYEAPQV